MLALKIIGGIVLALVLLGQVRVGVLASFGEALRVAVRIGPVTKQIIPAPEKKPKAAPEKKAAEEKTPEKPKKSLPKLSFDELRGALSAIWQALQNGLRATCRRVRIRPMQLSVVVGGEDPAQTAQVYGWLSAAVWTVMPRLEELSQLPEPYIHIGVDFDAAATKVEGTVGVSLRLHDLLAIAVAFIKPVVKWGVPFLRAKKARESAAQTAASQDTAPRKEEPEKIA